MLSKADSPVTPAEADVLGGLPGLEAAGRQLEDVLAVLRAEQQRRAAGAVITRPAWKNLMLAGGPGSGKSRTAAAAGRAYRELGLLSSGHLDEVTAPELAGATRAETGSLVAAAAKHSTGGILMICDAHAWLALPDRGQHILWELYKKLTEYRKELRDDLAVILAGQAGPLRELLYAAPPLAARFAAVIEFPGYTSPELTAIFTALAGEAGLSLAPEASSKAAAVIAQAEAGQPAGNARLAVRLLTQVTAAQARRLAVPSEAHNSSALSKVTESDIPDHLDPGAPSAPGKWPGQYL